jgi:hypothetical protein
MLDEHLDRLLALFWRDRPRDGLLIGELHAENDEKGFPVVAGQTLVSPEAYAARFGTLMKAGYSWINLSFYGCLRGTPLVVVELPARPSGADSTSVNLSGPMAAVAENGGEIDGLITVRD